MTLRTNRTFRSFALLVVLCSVGLSTPNSPLNTRDLPRSAEKLAALRQQGFELYSRHQYQPAIVIYSAAREEAIRSGENIQAVLFLNNIAGCHFALTDYIEAMRNFQAARDESRRHQLIDLETLAAYNMASIQLSLGRADRAEAWIKQFPLDGSTMQADSKLEAFLLQAGIFTRLDRPQQARFAFNRALHEADREPTARLLKVQPPHLKRYPESLRELRRARVFAFMAQCLLKLKQPTEAEAYALEAFRIRAIYRDNSRAWDALQISMIDRRQGRPEASLITLAAAQNIDSFVAPPMHSFLVSKEQALAQLELGQLLPALHSLRSALDRARQFRLHVLPTDSSYLQFESYLNSEVQEEFLKLLASSDLPLNTGNLPAESFWISEEARFASLRASQLSPEVFTSRLDRDFWPALQTYQALQAQLLRGDPVDPNQITALQNRLYEMELKAGLSIPPTPESAPAGFREWQKNLDADETVFAYFVAEPNSLVWTIRHNSIHLRRISGRAELAQLVREFRTEILDRSQNGTSRAGLKLSFQLFGDTTRAKATTSLWTMVLDQQLNDLPVAALPSMNPEHRYLVETQTLRIVPSALDIRLENPVSWTGSAVGIGDPIYNSLDSRLGKKPTDFRHLLQLNRLPASAKELASGFTVMEARHWNSSLLMGSAAHGAALRQSIGSSPDILHLSTHFLSQPQTNAKLSIVLSPEPGQTSNSLFGSQDLNALRTRSKLVVLSGCTSSAGEVIPHIGIDGLARSFLIAGADSVLATLWPTEDNDGPLFPVFYQHLLEGKWSPRAAARSLRAAQLAMIQRGGWVSKPAYWAAYLPISRG